MKTNILLFVLALALFLIGLSSQEIISFDARFYLFALEMWRHGVSWFATTYGQPYPDYPVTSTFLIYCSASLFGVLNKFTAVLPSAIAAALTVVLTYQIGALHRVKYGLYAVLALLGTFAFFKSARAIALDMYPVLFTTACFYLIHSAHLKKQFKKVFWIYPLLVLSFIFRGPIGLVMPAGVVCVYYLIEGEYKQFFIKGIAAFFLLLLCTATLLILAYQAGGDDFMHDVLSMEVIGRFGGKAIPLLFYFRDSFVSYALTYPFAFAMMLGVLCGCRGKAQDKKLLLQLTGWMLVILIGMSIPGDKKVRYVLPMAPALALLVAYLWDDLPTERYFFWIRRITLITYAFLPTLFLAATLYVLQMSVKLQLVGVAPYLPMIIFFGAMQVVLALMLVRKRTGWTILFGTITLLAAELLLVEPITQSIDKTRDFVMQVENMRQHKQAALVFYRERIDGLPIKYLVNTQQEAKPVFIDRAAALVKMQMPAVIITDADVYQSMPANLTQQYAVLTTGRIGHVDVVVFERQDKGAQVNGR